MSASIRFLGLAVLAWAGVRAASLGLIPGTEGLAAPAEAATRPVTPVMARSEIAASPQVPPAGMATGQPYPVPYAPYPPYPPYAAYPSFPQPVAVPYYYPVPAAMPRRPMPRGARTGWDEVAPMPAPLYDGWGLAEPPEPTKVAAATIEGGPPARTASAIPPGPPALEPGKRFDRLQLSAWALLRGSWGPGALALGGTLGGSQVGARLTYKFTPSLTATLRSSSSVGGVRYAEAAAGVRWQPLASVPVALNFERRQALNRWGGRNAFALFAEGGLYQSPILGIANLDLYAQGGVVGLKSRDLFFDGGATLTRPVWKKVSAGAGIWGGMQPGLYRVDAGPRVSMDLGRGIRVHADYRQRIAGEAMPTSGPALTVAGDF